MKIEILAWAMIPLLLAIPVARAADARAEASDEEHSVYASLLAERWDESPFVVERETSDSGHSRDVAGAASQLTHFLKEKLQGQDRSVSLDEKLVESYWRLQSARVQLNAKALKAPHIKVVASEEIDAIFRNSRPLTDSWAAFREKYEGTWGIVRLSRVAFSADGSQALLSASGSCGPRCGGGEYFWLWKTDGKWRIVARTRGWVS